MPARRRPKSVRKARAKAIAREERAYSKDPHSFIFTRPGVGSLVKQLTLDLRGIFEPYTATRLKTHKRNVLKDFIAVAGPLHVTHLLYLTHARADKRESKRERQSAKRTVNDQNANVSGSDLKAVSSSTNRDQCQGKPLESSHTSVSARGGGVYLHLIRVPHGPSFTFSVCEYSLKRDVVTLVRRVFDSHQFRTPPLLAMTGFGTLYPDDSGSKKSQPPPPHLRLMVDMFQNMLPPLNVQKLKLSTVRRILLISREVDLSSTNGSSDDKSNTPDDVIYIRHYHIRTENRTISRALRRLRLGGASAKKRRLLNLDPSEEIPKALLAPGLGPGGSGKSSGVPNLAKYTRIEDFLTKSGMLSDSDVSDAFSDMDEVDLPHTQLTETNDGTPVTLTTGKKRKFVPAHGLRHLGAAKRATVRLTEIGPRLTLKLIKIEEGLNSGTVLYHRWQSRSLAEVADQAERLRQREALRAGRRAEHEARRAANEAAREAHRQACLEGMRRAGQLPEKANPEQRLENAEDTDSSASDASTNVKSVPPESKNGLQSVKRSKSKGKRKITLAVRGSSARVKSTISSLTKKNRTIKTSSKRKCSD